MIIESGTIYRSIAAQNEFSFEFSVENSNVSGISSFGFSGDSGNLNLFKFNSGQIFDFNNRYVWSYNPREEIRISGNIGSGYLNYFINKNPVCLFSPQGNLYYDKFYINTSNSSINFDLFIQGLKPDYEIIYPSTVGLSQNVTGFIRNISTPLQRSFEILSGITFDVNLDYTFSKIFSGNISGGQSGIFILQPSINNQINEPTLNTVNLVFQTNFGNIDTQLTYNVIPSPIYFTELVTGYTGLLGLVENFTLQKFYNYELQSIYPTNRNVNVILENFTGHTGQVVFSEFTLSGSVNNLLSGFIYGFDYLTGYATGTGIGSSLNFYQKYPTGKIQESIILFQPATGFIDYRFNLPIYGGSGTGTAPSGTIITGSGYINSGNFSGFIYGSNEVYATGKGVFTGYYLSNLGVNIRSGIESFYLKRNFTGNFNNKYENFNWSIELITGSSIIGTPYFYTGESSLIIGMTGQRSFTITGLDSNGIYYNNFFINTDQNSGIHLEPLIKSNSNTFISSGSGSSSQEETLRVRNAFTGDNYFYFTGETGWLIFSFTGYSTNDKKPISHISLNIDKNVLNLPSNVSVQVSQNGSIWQNIYTGIFNPLEFYDNDTKYLRFNSVSTLNTLNTYEYVRFLYASTSTWPHQSTQNIALSKKIGIKNLQFHHGYNINIVSGNNLSYKLNYDTLTGYQQISGYNPKAFSGEVLYSRDSALNPSWYAFNKNKNDYPFAKLFPNDSGNIFVGYKTDTLVNNLTGFRIEFVSGEVPSNYSIDISSDGTGYFKVFSKTSGVSLIETGFFNIVSPYQYFILNLDAPDPCVFSPVSGHPCYQTVISNHPECCEDLWSSGCQVLFDVCTGLFYPQIFPPLLQFGVSGWSILFYTGGANIQEYSISNNNNIVTIQEPNNIYISTNSGNSGTYILSNPGSGSATPFKQFKVSANGEKLITLLSSNLTSNFTGVGRSWATTNFAVKTLNISSGEWSTVSGLYNRVFFDERPFFGFTGQYKINDGNLILNADDYDISNNGQHIIFYKYNQTTFDASMGGNDDSLNYINTYWGFINNNTYLGLYDVYNDNVPFSGIQIANNGFFAGLCGAGATLQDFNLGPNKLFTGSLLSRSPMLNVTVNERSDAFLNGTDNLAITLLSISKINGSCITVGAKSGRLISSRNSGNAWVSGSGINTNFPWKKILLSDSGRHQSAIFGTGILNLYSNNQFPAYSGYGIYTSSNTGISWNYITGGRFLIDYNISPNGKYVGFIHKNDLNSSSILYTSNNYGITGSFSGINIINIGLNTALDIQQLKISDSGIYAIKYNNYLFNKQIL